jgi:TonB family protein
MRMKFLSSILALLFLVPHLFAGESTPAVKFAVAPKYPTLTLAGRVYGEVLVRVTIDRAGAVKTSKVIEGHPMLQATAVNAAQQWKFEESSLLKRVATLRFNFVILPKSSNVASQIIFLPPTGIEIRQKPVEPAVEDQEGEFHLEPQPVSKT